jgi:hypothetical protein
MPDFIVISCNCLLQDKKIYLINPEKIYLPPLHIKLVFTKKFCQSNGSTQRWIYVLENKFPRVSDAKIKEGVFVGPQIRS